MSVLWTPDPAARAQSRMLEFYRALQVPAGLPETFHYSSFHKWSVCEPASFWSGFWDFSSIIGEKGDALADPQRALVTGSHMLESKWFPGSRLNFAENLLHRNECSARDGAAIIFRAESGERREVSWEQLEVRSHRFAVWLRAQGVKAGDRVAGVLPNIPEAVICMLGTASIGAIWSCCSPDFGTHAIVERFRQIEPAVLLTASNCTYGGKPHSPIQKCLEILGELPTVRALCVLGDIPSTPAPSIPTVSMHDVLETGSAGAPRYERFSFDHPLCILYSSGTTGAPKCIVHGQGGTLLQLKKEHVLHTNVHAGDRVLFFTTTGWMMWNWLVNALAAGATIVLYDGAPLHPPSALFDVVSDERVTAFGAGAKYFASIEKAGLTPSNTHDLTALRAVLSTGSPLLPESFDYIYRSVKRDVCLSSISGGTDIISCFALGSPTEPVRRGELQVKGLGMDVKIFGDAGEPVTGIAGELVCCTPFPSMPVSFWNDPEKKKYRSSYFDMFDNVWRHGDWAEETPSGGLIIYGRSDTTLNPGGVRIGTAEIYREVDSFDEILESLAVPRRSGGDEDIMLFIRLRPGIALTSTLQERIRQQLRLRCSPRHVPAEIVAADDFPRTISGKLSEIAVRNALNGYPVKNLDALANPGSLDFFRDLFKAPVVSA